MFCPRCGQDIVVPASTVLRAVHAAPGRMVMAALLFVDAASGPHRQRHLRSLEQCRRYLAWLKPQMGCAVIGHDSDYCRPWASMQTSVLTLPGLTRVTLPVSWLRTEKRMPSASVTTMTEGALIMAIT